MIECFTESTALKLSVLNKMVDEFISIYKGTENIYKPILTLTIIAEDKRTLGFCAKDTTYKGGYVIGISEKLFDERVSAGTLREVVGHEVAHLIDMVRTGDSGHDAEFKRICSILGVMNDTAKLQRDLFSAPTSNSLIEKIKKLLALSESDNEHESSSAMLKARKLMMDNNIDTIKDEDKVYRAVLTEYKNYTSELSCIVAAVREITGCFIVLGTGRVINKVHAHGSKSEVEIAEYLFNYLKRELAKEYKEYKKKWGGYGAKKAFYLGVYSTMLDRFKKQESSEQWAIVAINSDKVREKAMSYIYSQSRISSHVTNGNVRNSSAYSAGKVAGNNVKIHAGVTASKSSNKYLT